MVPPTLCKITSNATGAGYYNARRQIRRRTPYFNPATALTLATYYKDLNSYDDIYVVNNGDTGHSIAANTYVWCEIAGPSTGTSPRMVFSVLGTTGGASFPVNLSSSSGSSGSNIPPTQANLTYTATGLDGTVLGTGVQLWFARQYGQVTAATHGMAFRIGSTLWLSSCDEVIEAANCT